MGWNVDEACVGGFGMSREPQPTDGPDYHANHAMWKAEQEEPIIRLVLLPHQKRMIERMLLAVGCHVAGPIPVEDDDDSGVPTYIIGVGPGPEKVAGQ